MQDHAADQLHVEMAHAEFALAGFADDGKGFGQQVVERFAIGVRPRNSSVLARNSSSLSAWMASARTH
jgi:hypothetical protein